MVVWQLEEWGSFLWLRGAIPFGRRTGNRRDPPPAHTVDLNAGPTTGRASTIRNKETDRHATAGISRILKTVAIFRAANVDEHRHVTSPACCQTLTQIKLVLEHAP
jgi:hypothetical protein